MIQFDEFIFFNPRKCLTLPNLPKNFSRVATTSPDATHGSKMQQALPIVLSKMQQLPLQLFAWNLRVPHELSGFSQLLKLLGDKRDLQPEKWRESLFHGYIGAPTDLGWWVYPLLYGNNGSWSTLAHMYLWILVVIRIVNLCKVLFLGSDRYILHESTGFKLHFHQK